MGPISSVSPAKYSYQDTWKEIYHARKYIINLDHPYMPQRNDNPKTTNKKGYPRVWLGMCYPNHPSNGRYPFQKPPVASITSVLS